MSSRGRMSRAARQFHPISSLQFPFSGRLPKTEDKAEKRIVTITATKGEMIPGPESELEYDSGPSFNPNSSTGLFALKSVVLASLLVSTLWVR